ncbi:MAG: tryptophan synthase alpha chain [Alphaproteobacteria bacterium]|jgi:tryptophan synthase alpha chain
MCRIRKAFEVLKQENRAGLITFITAGDPNLETSQRILNQLPSSGVDIIELGMPFTDPMADGKAIQQANIRALKNGQNITKTLKMVKDFRHKNTHTPVILMGYYNPIYIYGIEKFLVDANNSGIDGVIIVDLPPEEEEEFTNPAKKYDINLVRLITPTSDIQRMNKITKNAGGFIYYVSVAGITGGEAANKTDLAKQLQAIRTVTDLPIAVGFGIKTPQDVKDTADIGADAVVVGSAIVQKIGTIETSNGETVDSVLKFVKTLSDSLKG